MNHLGIVAEDDAELMIVLIRLAVMWPAALGWICHQYHAGKGLKWFK